MPYLLDYRREYVIMRLEVFEFEPVKRQGNWLKELNERLRRAVKVEMFSVPAYNQGEDQRTIIIYALIEV